MRVKMQEKSTESVLAIVLGFLVLHIWLTNEIWLYIALAIGVCGTLSSYLRNAIALAWSQISLFLGYVNGRVVLTIVFVVVLIPMAVLRRIFTSNEKIIKSKRSGTYFVERNHVFSPKDLENPW